MSQGGKQHRPTSQEQRKLLNEQREIEATLDQQRQLEGLEEGHEFDSAQAAQLQPNLGNQSVQDLVNRLNNVDSELAQLDQEGGELEEEQQEDFEFEEDLKGSFGGGTPEGGSASSNPWETEFFYGGDDDDEAKTHKKRRRRRRVDYLPTQEEDDKEETQAPRMPVLEDVLPTPEQGKREGDAQYKTVELCLQDPMSIFGQSLNPDDLKNRKGHLDPIRGPIDIGRFFSQHAQKPLAKSISSVLGGPLSPLMASQGGSSTAIARLATLTVCAEALEGGQERTDHALSLILHKSSWGRAVQAAKYLSQKGQLHAPKICSLVLGREFEEIDNRLPTPNHLGGAALKATLPHPLSVSKPYLAIQEEEAEEMDELVALLDRTMSTLITGMTPEQHKKTVVDYEILQPALKSANGLLGALGRAQVEFAAAAISVKNTFSQAATVSTLKYADTALRQLAQATVRAGKTLEKLYGSDIRSVQEQSSTSIRLLEETILAMNSLRTWCFSTLAGSINPIVPKEKEPTYEA